MATPIKETPVLSEKYWGKFIDKVEKDRKDPSKKVSKEEYDKSKEIFDKVMANASLQALTIP